MIYLMVLKLKISPDRKVCGYNKIESLVAVAKLKACELFYKAFDGAGSMKSPVTCFCPRWQQGVIQCHLQTAAF